MMNNHRLLHTLTVVITLLITQVNSQMGPEIGLDSLQTIKRVGETGTLNCTVTRQSTNRLLWIFQSRVLTSDNQVMVEDLFNPIIDGQRKFDVHEYRSGDSTTYMLVVRRLQLTDAGTYTCQMQIRGEPIFHTIDAEMIVHVPSYIIPSQTTITATVQEGQDVSMRCNAEGVPNPVITWVRPNRQLLPEPMNMFSHIGTSIQMTNVSRTASGVYRCIADNNVIPTASQDITLYVNFQPYAEAVQSSYGQASNRQVDVTIECMVSGYPSPDLQWFKVIDGGTLQPVNDDERHRVHTITNAGQTLGMEEVQFQLTIISVLTDDYGNYTCQGVNSLGAHTAVIELYETFDCQGEDCDLADDFGINSSTSRNTLPILATPFLSLLTVLYIQVVTHANII